MIQQQPKLRGSQNFSLLTKGQVMVGILYVKSAEVVVDTDGYCSSFVTAISRMYVRPFTGIEDGW